MTTTTKSQAVQVSKVEVKAHQQSKLDKLDTKSAKIRYLNSEDYTRGQIAKILNIRYQHVRNVLITPVKNPKA